MPRPSNTQERRKEIALALARVMAIKGYDGASIASIAAEAGVAAGGVHYHFASKAEILDDLVRRLVEVATGRVEARLAGARTSRERLDALLDGLLDARGDADPEAVAVWSLIGSEAVRNADVRKAYEAWLSHATEQLRDAFSAACADEGRSAAGASRIATGLVAMVEGFYAVAAGAPAAIEPGSAAPIARRFAQALVDQQPELER